MKGKKEREGTDRPYIMKRGTRGGRDELVVKRSRDADSIVKDRVSKHKTLYTRAGERTMVHLVDDLPGDAVDAPNGRVGELVEGVGREIEVAVGASLAAIRQLHFDRFALVCG